MKKRKIAVVTGARAEYGILKPLLKRIKSSSELELKLIAAGMHLLKNYGLTVNEIKKDGFKINSKIAMYFGSEKDAAYHGRALGVGTKKFTEIFSQLKPDILVILGDRLEPLASALAAAALRIPIAHIHGGDKTDSGHIDESIRHSITRFAHIHFASTRQSMERLIKMGEEPWRVHNVGTLGIDSILDSPRIRKEVLLKKLGLAPNQKLILCIFNPVHLEAEKAGKQMREIVKALKALRNQAMIVYPNNDAGSRAIIGEIEKVKNLSFVKTSLSLCHTDYVNLLRWADVLIGNSSSGIIEAPALKLPAVNIGLRNVGREHAENILFVQACKNDIITAVKKALFDKKFKKMLQRCKNPYGKGGASIKIIKILSKIKIEKRLLQKKITY